MRCPLPNWCHNKLTISGDPEVVEAFVAAVAQPEQEPEPGANEAQAEPVAVENRITQPLDFNRIAPMPEELLEASGDPEETAELRRRFGTADWYEWALVNWGTKWNANFEGVFLALAVDEDAEVPSSRRPIIEPGRAFYAFETAWSPPVPVLSTLAARYPNLNLELVWGEPGSDVAGRIVWRQGRLHSDEELPLEQALSPKEMWF
jgi:Api92-like protein with ferredoxin domain